MRRFIHHNRKERLIIFFKQHLVVHLVLLICEENVGNLSAEFVLGGCFFWLQDKRMCNISQSDGEMKHVLVPLHKFLSAEGFVACGLLISCYGR